MPELSALLASELVTFADDSDQQSLIGAAARFHERWHPAEAIADAFNDLCT